MTVDSPKPRDQLRAAGLRVTAPRLAVLDWLTTHPHATADQVATGVRERLETVSTQAIYDVLNTCTQARLLRRIEPAGHPARYETRTADNHHHLVCRTCNRIANVDYVVGFTPCLEPPGTPQFVVDDTEVTFWGICPSCAA
jgi:Fur family transcriptional regulator, stress-responsive regulator